MKKRTLCLLLIFLSAALASAQIQITLKQQFVNDFADRVTIDSSFRVDITSKVHSASQDGDIHVAGTSPETGMLTVAELMNAKTEKTKAVKVMMDAKGTNTPIPISGAWRIWSEHGGAQNYVQGADVPVADSSGVAHVFQIHPITNVAGEDVRQTWEPIAGFTYKDADQAFPNYERTHSIISQQDGMVTISTEQAAFNYTEFVAKLLGDPFHLNGGTGVMAAIFDKNGELLVNERRLVFAAGTPPEQIIMGKHKGDALQVVGIPRINLKLVKWRVDNQNDATKCKGCLSWNLPYELIVAAVTEESVQLPE